MHFPHRLFHLFTPSEIHQRLPPRLVRRYAPRDIGFHLFSDVERDLAFEGCVSTAEQAPRHFRLPPHQRRSWVPSHSHQHGCPRSRFWDLGYILTPTPPFAESAPRR